MAAYGWTNTRNSVYLTRRRTINCALLSVVRGDANNTGTINLSDAVYLIAYIHAGGYPPQPNIGVGDVNCDGAVNISDAVYLVAYIFSGGRVPCFACP